jgi:hypothetical protein
MLARSLLIRERVTVSHYLTETPIWAKSRDSWSTMKRGTSILAIAGAALALLASSQAFSLDEGDQAFENTGRISLPDGKGFNDQLDSVKFPLCRYGYAIPVPPYRNPSCRNAFDCLCLTHRRCIRSHLLPGPLPPLTNCACDIQFLDAADRVLTTGQKKTIGPFIKYWKNSFCLAAKRTYAGKCKIGAYSGASKKRLNIASLLFSCQT